MKNAFKMMAVVLALGVLVSGGVSVANTKNIVKIGILLGYSGPIESLTPFMAEASELAIKEVNNSNQFMSGKYEIQSVRADSTCVNYEKGLKAAKKLINVEKVSAIMGADCSGVTTAVLKNVAMPNGVLMISPSATSPALSTEPDNDLFFRTAPSDARQGEVIADLLMEKGFKSAALTHTNNDYGKSLAASIKKNYEAKGGKITITASHEDGKGDYSSEVAALAQASGDILIVAGYLDQGGKGIIQASLDADAFNKFFLPDGMIGDYLPNAIGPALNGSIGSLPRTDSTGNAKYAKLAKAAGFNSGPYGPESYDAAALIMLAMQAAKSTDSNVFKNNIMDIANAPGEKIFPGELNKAIKLIKEGKDIDYVGASGVELRANGDTIGNFDEILINNERIVRSHFLPKKSKVNVKIAQNIKPFKPKSKISRAELNAERQKRKELERKLAALENKQKQEQKRIDSDNQGPIINAFSKQDGSNAIITGRVTDNTEVAEVLVDGQVQELKSNGTFETPFYIPRTGKTIEIVAYDIKGNKASKILKLERSEIQSADKQQFKSLNPSLKKVKANPNALALIIGISDYENTKASALYADSDAKMFYDYANLKLGILSSNIKELVNDKADRIDITRAIKTWLLKRTVTDKTDIYVFFAGHGLATDDGKGMYLLPYDGVPDLLEDSAIQRKEFFANLHATKPRSVTVFLDTCYSGGTRNEEETLVANLRPIIITAKQQSIPSNFTVLSAAKGNQTSQSLEEVKHGLFSYYTMIGMEGGADTNNDNKITARELHSFVLDKVERQSQFRQTPELQGDKDRVLVQFN